MSAILTYFKKGVNKESKTNENNQLERSSNECKASQTFSLDAWQQEETCRIR
jgi:hypothetical protein